MSLNMLPIASHLTSSPSFAAIDINLHECSLLTTTTNSTIRMIR